jgi:hypothetical protein
MKKITEAIKEVKESVDYTENDFQVEQEIESVFSVYAEIHTAGYEESSEDEKEQYEMFFEGGSDYSWHSHREEPEISQEKIDSIIEDLEV